MIMTSIPNWLLIPGIFLGAPIFLFLCAKWFFAGYFKAKERHEKKATKTNKYEIE